MPLSIQSMPYFIQDDGDYVTADSVVRKLTAMYTVLAVEQVLHEHKLASEPHMLENIEHPTRLIQSILESTHHDSSDRGKKVVLYG